MTAPYYGNIERDTVENTAYRRVIYTDAKKQIVLMCLDPKQEIGMESHPDSSQFFRFEKGTGLAIVEGKGYLLSDGIALSVPPGRFHNIINTSSTQRLHLYTIYSPPHHPPGTYQLTKPLDD